MRAPLGVLGVSIPNKVSAASVLTHAHEFSGELTVKSLERLKQAIAGEQGSIEARLVTERNNGVARVHGSIGGSLGLACQRCQKRFDWPLQLLVDLRLVFSDQEEAAALHGSDPYRVENDELPLRELVEDEVLLALPMLARCETCENVVPASSAKAKQPVATRRDNPFAALKDQLKKS